MIAPVEKSVTVPARPEAAFERWTGGMNDWWPRETHTVFRERCDAIGVEGGAGGRIVETSLDGETAEWGRIEAWDPPGRFDYTWYPGREPEFAQRVEMRFELVEGGTRVQLLQGGWEILGPAAEMVRDGYESAWSVVIGAFAASFESPRGASPGGDR